MVVIGEMAMAVKEWGDVDGGGGRNATGECLAHHTVMECHTSISR